jgi:hypothetical protein
MVHSGEMFSDLGLAGGLCITLALSSKADSIVPEFVRLGMHFLDFLIN